MRPYTPLELAGRNIYVREGCYVCHCQMIRPFRDEVERYGHYSLAAESMYDHPFQWGSKRTGPDLARVGGKYSNDWHAAHLADPRSVVPESSCRPTPSCSSASSTPRDIADHLRTLRTVGVPYSDEMIEAARADLAPRPTPRPTTTRCSRATPRPRSATSTATRGRLTEMDALVAYLQILGRMVDFDDVTPEDLRQ